MSYLPKSLDEISSKALLGELKRRYESLEQFKCPYCGLDYRMSAHACKFVDTLHEQLYGFNSVLRPWVMSLPLREQGILLVSTRGCDLTPKYPLNSLERELVALIRFTVMIPADEREVDSEPGCFMVSKLSDSNSLIKPSKLGHYPWHWLSHILHACEVIAYRHPNKEISNYFFSLYEAFCISFHLYVERKEEMIDRLSEDRIVRGNIVS